MYKESFHEWTRTTVIINCWYTLWMDKKKKVFNTICNLATFWSVTVSALTLVLYETCNSNVSYNVTTWLRCYNMCWSTLLPVYCVSSELYKDCKVSGCVFCVLVVVSPLLYVERCYFVGNLMTNKIFKNSNSILLNFHKSLLKINMSKYFFKTYFKQF